MKRRRLLIVGGLLLSVLAAAAYLVCTFGFAAPGDRLTLMYFRADL